MVDIVKSGGAMVNIVKQRHGTTEEILSENIII